MLGSQVDPSRGRPHKSASRLLNEASAGVNRRSFLGILSGAVFLAAAPAALTAAILMKSLRRTPSSVASVSESAVPVSVAIFLPCLQPRMRKVAEPENRCVARPEDAPGPATWRG